MWNLKGIVKEKELDEEQKFHYKFWTWVFILLPFVITLVGLTLLV